METRKTGIMERKNNEKKIRYICLRLLVVEHCVRGESRAPFQVVLCRKNYANVSVSMSFLHTQTRNFSLYTHLSSFTQLTMIITFFYVYVASRYVCTLQNCRQIVGTCSANIKTNVSRRKDVVNVVEFTFQRLRF